MVSAPDKTVKRVLAELEAGAGGDRERAWFHPFPARMPLNVAAHVVRGLSAADSVVLDPMMGSGTTLVAAREAGRFAVGFDRDPLAVLVSRCASNTFRRLSLVGQSERILARANVFNRTKSPTLNHALSLLPREDSAFVQYWFSDRARRQLLALSWAIDEEPPGPDRDFARVVFSSLIIAKSAGASYALDISRSRPHKRLDKPIVLPFDAWTRRTQTAIARLPFLDATDDAAPRVGEGDARKLPIEESTADLVLTSPPYLNAVDYLRAHKFSLVWMGHRLDELRDLRTTQIGTERGMWQPDGLPDAMEARLDSLVFEARRRAMVRRYLSDLNQVLAEIKRVLRPGGLAVLVVGPSIVGPNTLDAGDVLVDLASHLGLQCIGSVTRPIAPGRRSLPPPSLVHGGALSLRMGSEVFVVLRK